MIGLALLAAASPLVHANAALNSLATVLLLIGYAQIRAGREVQHKRTMLAAFAVSSAFLVCYLVYHYSVGSVKFTNEGVVRYVYLAILFSHILLAISVPFLAITTIYLGFRAHGCCGGKTNSQDSQSSLSTTDYRRKHRRWARVTFPIWLYVSVTGVIVYVMLYHLWPPDAL